MSQDSAVARPRQHMQEAADRTLQNILNQPKPTFTALDKAITEAADSVDLTDHFRSVANEALKNQLFLSPRLQHWQQGVSKDNVVGYWVKNSAQNATITVSEERVVLSCPDPSQPKYPFNYEVMVGLPAATLFKSIEDAQAIIQPRNVNGIGLIDAAGDDSDEFFQSGEEPFYQSAGLDAALEETHADPLIQDDADLIEEVTAINPSEPVDIDAELASITKEAEALKKEIEQHSFTAKANRKNATIDGVQCEYCGNLNRDAYKGSCPQCPKAAGENFVTTTNNKVTNKSKDAAARFKSLQGRILTIIDGTFSDKTQREAVKQMINKEFGAEITKAGE